MRRIVAEVQNVVDRREAVLPRERHRLDRDLLAARGEGASTTGTATCSRRRRLVHAAGRLRRPSRWRSSRLATRGSPSASTSVGAARWRTSAAMRDLLGTRLESAARRPMDSGDRPEGGGAGPAAGPDGAPQGRFHFAARLPRVDGVPRRREPGRRRRGTSSSASRRRGRARPGPSLRLLPARISLEDVRSMAPADDRRLLVGVDERERSRPWARRRHPSRTCWSSATGSRARARCCGPMRTR